MPRHTFASPGLATFTGLDDHGLKVISQDLTSSQVTLECRVAKLTRGARVAVPWVPPEARSVGVSGLPPLWAPAHHLPAAHPPVHLSPGRRAVGGWRRTSGGHTRGGDNYVPVIIDLTTIKNRTGWPDCWK